MFDISTHNAIIYVIPLTSKKHIKNPPQGAVYVTVRNIFHFYPDTKWYARRLIK